MRPDRMWQNSKALPLIEWVSPGVASQTPLLIISPRESSCAQVLNSGEPEIRRSGSGRAALGVNFGSVSMVTRSDMSVSLGLCSVPARAIDQADHRLAGLVAADVVDHSAGGRVKLSDARHMRRDHQLRVTPQRVPL